MPSLPSLTTREPHLDRARLVRELVPPPRFGNVRFENYEPDPAYPSQSAAVQRLRQFAAMLTAPEPGSRWWRRGRVATKAARGAIVGAGGSTAGARGSTAGARGSTAGARGVYLDGGFGVGKTHLLASLWHAAPTPKAFGTFVEFTNLVGALGFQQTVTSLQEFRLLCIDEFELDDPGDTVLMATLLTRLAEAGVALAATSNTLPEALGQGRFAAEDFLREIQALSSRFEVLTIDGEDYRHRGLEHSPVPLSDDEVEAAAARTGGTLDHFVDVTRHLERVHPSRYRALLDHVPAVGWQSVRTISDQMVALRLVVLADRLYDGDIPLFTSGESLDQLFAPELLRGGYRKKYYRALSRLVALANEAESGREAALQADAPPADAPPADCPPVDSPPADSPPADSPQADTPQAQGPAPGAHR
ncbi:MAG TPA: cell division protein ZapE [Dermatophilaceae bacterium]|nr:cell division protein ZapE [Dermatophilaceae bacterium]